MAVVDSQKDHALVKDVSERYIKTFYHHFVKGAFDFYSTNANIWEEHEHDPLYDLLENEEFSRFTTTARQAVITLAYIFRGTYRRRFEKELRHLKSKEEFMTLVLGYPLNKGEGFLSFLTWIAYLFELNLYFKIHKTDYEEVCKSCFSSLPWFSYFKVGTPYTLEEACSSIRRFYSPLVNTFHRSDCSCDILLPFTHAVGIVDREFKYDDTLMKIAMLHWSPDPNYGNLELQLKFRVLSSYNLERITLGYKSRNKIKRQDEIKKLSVESSEIEGNLNLAEEKQECIESRLNASPRKVTPSRKSPLDFNNKRSFAVVTDRYLLKRQKAKHNAYESEFKRDIKIFSTINGEMKLVENLMNVLDENVEKNNLYKITDGVFAVYPLNCDNEDFDDKIIVLDTSSDDDDDDPQLDLHQREFKRRVIPELRKWKYCTSNNNEKLKRTYEMREKLKYEVQRKPPREEVLETNMQSTGAMPKGMDSTEENHETSKKKQRSRIKKQARISMENTDPIPQDINSIDANFETAPEMLLTVNSRGEIPMNNSERRHYIDQIFEEFTSQNTLIANKMYKEFLEDIEHVPADTGQEETSASSSDEGENTIGQKLEKSESTFANIQQEEILQGYTGAIRKKRKPFMEHTNPSKQSSKKSNTVRQTIRPRVLYKDVNSMTDKMEKIELISDTSTGAKGKNSLWQNLGKSETTNSNAQHEEISRRNTGATPKTQKPSKEHKNSSKQSSKISNPVCQTIRPGTENKDLLKSMAELRKKMESYDMLCESKEH